MTIRSRIVVALVGLLAVALFLVVSLSTVLIGNAFRKTLDQNLQNTTRAVAALVDIKKHAIKLDREDLEQIQRLRADAHVAIVRRDGTILSGEQLPAIPAPLQQRGGLFDTQYQGRNVRVSIERITDAGETIGLIATWRHNDYIETSVRDTLLVEIFVALVVLGIGAVVARYVADSVVSPVNSIANLIERIEERDLSLRVGLDGRDELARLGASFDRMLDRLQAAFSREREFTADASHELRAPLAVLRAEVELALRRPRSAEEYREALEGAMREIERLESLVDALLSAARAEVDARHSELVDLRSVADDVVARTSNAAKVKNVSVTAAGEPVSIVADPVGIERALLAVVHNAVTHTPAQGVVSVRVSRENGTACVSVRDTGAGFSNAALANASKRFWRGDDSRPRGGSGLGLSIADAFVRANGGKLVWSNEPGGGAVVTFEFKVSA